MTDGILVVDKPSGITSHQVVARARRALGIKKIGHAGTLDPMATGVLVLGVGRGTRLLGHLALTAKEYTATVRLGQQTNTDDAEGEIIDAQGSQLSQVGSRLQATLSAFIGTIQQVPSAVSAIKIDGKRAYARVRAGEAVELPAREVTITRLALSDLREEITASGLTVVDVDLVVACSSGTYVRALARDLGRTLGVGGHLTRLRRAAVGPFTLAEVAWDADLGELEPGERLSLPVTDLGTVARRSFPVIEVGDDVARDVGYGRPIALEVPADPTGVLHRERLLALYRPGGSGVAVPVAVLVPHG
ncbi:MAG: tRNA pseudouridine(55) synthase TruB [Propioniciclava sp.]